jgi:predicted negative regulator of RcsB-dependent stress response
LGAKRVRVDKKVADAKGKPKEVGQESFMGFKEWLEAHQQKLTIVVASAFVLLLVVWGVNAYLDRKESSAQSEYAGIMKDWPSDESVDAKVWEGFQARLEKLIAGADGTRAALYAQMDLMRAFVQQKRFDQAVLLAAGLAGKVSTEKEMRPLLRYQLALTYDAAGRADEAVAQWNALRAEPFPGVEREVDWRLGRLHAGRKEYDKAVELYESALKRSGEYPSTPLLQEDLTTVKPKGGKGS